MNKTPFSWERFRKIPIVGIARNISLEDMINILPLYIDAGLSTVEITMNTPDAGKIIHYAADHFGNDLNVGAGTVCTLDDLDKSMSAGAQFIVTPVVDEQIIHAAKQRAAPIFPGAFTPTEIYRAWTAGADMVKVFPSPEPAYISNVRGPFHQIKLVPTGGVTLDNCTDFLQAGATGLGIGSQLFDKKLVKDKNWKGLSDHFALFVKKINAYYS